jgi:hypothetical protein
MNTGNAQQVAQPRDAHKHIELNTEHINEFITQNQAENITKELNKVVQAISEGAEPNSLDHPLNLLVHALVAILEIDRIDKQKIEFIVKMFFTDTSKSETKKTYRDYTSENIYYADADLINRVIMVLYLLLDLKIKKSDTDDILTHLENKIMDGFVSVPESSEMVINENTKGLQYYEKQNKLFEDILTIAKQHDYFDESIEHEPNTNVKIKAKANANVAEAKAKELYSGDGKSLQYFKFTVKQYGEAQLNESNSNKYTKFKEYVNPDRVHENGNNPTKGYSQYLNEVKIKFLRKQLELIEDTPSKAVANNILNFTGGSSESNKQNSIIKLENEVKILELKLELAKQIKLRLKVEEKANRKTRPVASTKSVAPPAAAAAAPPAAAPPAAAPPAAAPPAPTSAGPASAALAAPTSAALTSAGPASAAPAPGSASATGGGVNNLNNTITELYTFINEIVEPTMSSLESIEHLIKKITEKINTKNNEIAKLEAEKDMRKKIANLVSEPFKNDNSYTDTTVKEQMRLLEQSDFTDNDVFMTLLNAIKTDQESRLTAKTTARQRTARQTGYKKDFLKTVFEDIIKEILENHDLITGERFVIVIENVNIDKELDINAYVSMFNRIYHMLYRIFTIAFKDYRITSTSQQGIFSLVKQMDKFMYVMTQHGYIDSSNNYELTLQFKNIPSSDEILTTDKEGRQSIHRKVRKVPQPTTFVRGDNNKKQFTFMATDTSIGSKKHVVPIQGKIIYMFQHNHKGEPNKKALVRNTREENRSIFAISTGSFDVSFVYTIKKDEDGMLRLLSMPSKTEMTKNKIDINYNMDTLFEQKQLLDTYNGTTKIDILTTEEIQNLDNNKIMLKIDSNNIITGVEEENASVLTNKALTEQKEANETNATNTVQNGSKELQIKLYSLVTDVFEQHRSKKEQFTLCITINKEKIVIKYSDKTMHLINPTLFQYLFGIYYYKFITE